MQNPPLSTPPPTPEGVEPQAGLLNGFLKRRPYTGTLLIMVYFAVVWIVLRFVAGPVINALHLSYFPREIVAELLLFIMLVSVPIFVLKWWSQTGFTRGIDSVGVVISLLPLTLFLLPSLCGLPLLITEATPYAAVMAAILSLTVALAEEGFFRGVLMSALLPKGIWPAVLISSLLFSCVHLTNLFSGFTLVYVIGQLVLTFGSGMLFAALRVRTRSIWPSVLLHFLRDWAGLIILGVNPHQALSGSLAAVLIVNGIFTLLCIINAVVLLRPSQMKKLRVAYGLDPAPVIPSVFAYPTYPAYAGQPGYGSYPYPPQPGVIYPGQQSPLIVYPDQQTPCSNPPDYPEQ